MDLLRSTVSGIVALLFFAAMPLAAQPGPPNPGPPNNIPNRPAQVSWNPTRVVNTHVVDGMIAVELTADRDVAVATLWSSASLDGLIGLPEGPLALIAGEPVVVELTLLMTPEEAGRTIGGTVHVTGDGRHLARPLVASLIRTETDPGDDPPGNGPPGDDPPGNGDPEPPPQVGGPGPFITWAAGEEMIRSLTQDLFEDGAAQLSVTPELNLTGAVLWPRPSLRDCVAFEISADNLIESGALEISGTGPGAVIDFVAAGQPILIDAELLVPAEELEACGGTLHLRNAGLPRRTWAAPLNVQLGAEGEDEEDSDLVAPEAVVGGASFQISAIAPGQIVSIFGNGVGPRDLVVFELDENGEVGEDLAGVMVFFDGIPARVLSVSEGQINVIAPRGLQGGEAELLVVHRGRQSTPFPVALRAVAPEVFALPGPSPRQAAALNQDGSLNGEGYRAQRGSHLVLFAGGMGPTDPPLGEGEVAAEALNLQKPVRVFIGGVEVPVRYAGTSPGLVGALTQINVELSGNVPAGRQGVVVHVDGVQSAGVATVWIE